MFQAELRGVHDSCAVSNESHLLLNGAREVSHSRCLVLWIKPSLEFGVMSGDARGAAVLMALQCLNTTKCEHESAGGADGIGPETKSGCDSCRVHHFSRGNQLHPAAKSGVDQALIDVRQTRGNG